MPFNMKVLVPALNDPELFQLPFNVCENDPASNEVPEPIVKFPPMVIPVAAAGETVPESVKLPFIVLTPARTTAPDPESVK
jgi:hypothetical protein